MINDLIVGLENLIPPKTPVLIPHVFGSPSLSHWSWVPIRMVYYNHFNI